MAYCRFLIALAVIAFISFLSSNGPPFLIAAEQQKIIITSPIDQSTVNETISIEGTYAKELNAHAIEVFIYQTNSPDPPVKLGANFASPFKYTWNTRNLKNGFWLVVAQADDANGQKIDSSYVGINVNNDWIAPIPYFTFYSDQGEIVSGMVTLTGGATDNVGVERAEFWLNDQLLASFQGPEPYKFKWDTTQINNGNAELRIIAYDKAGNKSGTPNLSYCMVVVQNPLKNPVPPVVKITSPKDDATLSGSVKIKGNVFNDKDLDHVTFMVQASAFSQNIKKGQPYQAQWDTKLEKDGYYWIHMYAYKKNNFLLGEHKVNVTVDNLGKPFALAPKVPPVMIEQQQAKPMMEEALAIELGDVKINGKNLGDLSRTIPLEDLRGKEALLTGKLENYARVSHLEVSLDGGRKWERIPARAEWSYRFKPIENKDYNLKFRVVMNDRTVSDLSVPGSRFRYVKSQGIPRMKGPSKPEAEPAEPEALKSPSQESMEQQDFSFQDSETGPS